MRHDKINALYYPDMDVDQTTLKKTILLFDELVPTRLIEKLNIKDVVRYRKDFEKAREEFLEYLSTLQAKQANISVDSDYADAIEKLIKIEIIPAANNFRNKIQTIDESFFGSLAKGTIGAVGGSGGLNIFGDLSWEKIILLGGAVGTYILKTTIDSILAKRAVKRECSISYILSLDT